MKTLRYRPHEGAPIADGDTFDLRTIGKIIGVGLNYRDHAEETGLALPKEPTLFLKATSALCGPSLQAGDVILTGTPAGVGFGQKPPTTSNRAMW